MSYELVVVAIRRGKIIHGAKNVYPKNDYSWFL